MNHKGGTTLSLSAENILQTPDSDCTRSRPTARKDLHGHLRLGQLSHPHRAAHTHIEDQERAGRGCLCCAVDEDGHRCQRGTDTDRDRDYRDAHNRLWVHACVTSANGVGGGGQEFKVILG